MKPLFPAKAAAAPRWTREQIRSARQAPLRPLLEKRGLTLIHHDAGNFEPADYPGLLLKDSYWRWPAHDKAGNAIDFLTQVLGLSFHNAMREITALTAPQHPPPPTTP